jgi:type IV pilus assembly protein PilB
MAMRLVDISAEEIAKGNMCKPVGCPHCGQIGYRGRKGIYELMRLNNEIRELAFARAPISKVRDAAIRAGMRPLVADGKLKILRGETTAVEVAQYAQADTLVASNVDI